MLENHTVKEVRRMTDEELDREHWDSIPASPVVVVFENGTRIYPSQDPEGNGPGALFGMMEVDGKQQPIQVRPTDEL